MHIKDISPFQFAEFGNPSIKKTFGLSLAKYNPGQIPGWKIAKRLSASGLLSVEAKKEVQLTNPSSPEEWEAIAKLELIPSAGYTVPYITEFMEALPRKARLSEITYDADFTTTLYKVLESYALNTPGKTTVYPLLDGPPGASKSIVVMVAAALLGLPVYTVTGSDGAADEIKIALLGGDNANADTILGLVKRYAYQGWLKNPLSLKVLAQAFKQYPSLNSVPEDTLMLVAKYENIRENITCYTPGQYQLAAQNGGILFLDEINGFKGVTTILTEILENYTVEQHPNFFIIGALNPAGEKHDRDPLPPEIRSRTATIYVKAPTVKSYQHMLQYLFTGEQPEITLPNGKDGKVTPAITGFSVPPRIPSLLQRSLQTDSFRSLIMNLANFHKHVESKYDEGLLNPAHSAVPSTLETTSVDRRMLVRGINSLDTYLHLLQDPDSDNLASGSYTMEEFLNGNTTEALTKEQIAAAITRMLSRIYLDAFNFPIEEELELEKNKKRKFASASEYLESLIDFNNLSYDKLIKSLRTQQDVKKLTKDWEKILASFKVTDEKEIKMLVEQALEDDIPAKKDNVTLVRSEKSNKPNLVHFPHLANKTSRKDFLEQNYPGISLKDATSASLLSIVDARARALRTKDKSKHIATLAEIKQATAFITNLRESTTNTIYFMFLATEETVQVGIIVPFTCFTPEVNTALRAAHPNTTYLSRVTPLRRNGENINQNHFLGVVNDLYSGAINGSNPLTVSHITEIVPLEILIKD